MPLIHIYELEELRKLNTRDYHFKIDSTIVSFWITHRDEKGNLRRHNPQKHIWVMWRRKGYPDLEQIDKMIGELVIKVKEYLGNK